MPSSLVSLQEWRRAMPFSQDCISLNNLRTLANAGHDAWGRPKQQPVSISVLLHLKNPISSAAEIDDLDASTVHYGSLSKDLLAKINAKAERWQDIESFTLNLLDDRDIAVKVAVAELEVRFPKASLSGEGVTFTQLRGYDQMLECPVLVIESMKLPALIGLNANERTMRQQIVVTVAFDRVNRTLINRPFEAEQIVSKTITETDFQTLESLTEHIAAMLIKYFILAYSVPDSSELAAAGVRIRVSKPIAILQADAPSVEIYRSSAFNDDFGRRMVVELGQKRIKVPFPLEGRLDDFLRR